ncbi:MAG: 7-carboxy-7-deazaguanine synthase QueE [Lachnoclostridium sp.]|nr:7-carboxy-7-deazaguanine synthase QueE [Lachnoclostridium sp.]
MSDKTFYINEIFYSLQGEGMHTGTAAVFVRFSGCNLRCDFCDTDHQAATPMTAEEIISAAASYPSRHVILTGGEPMLQVTEELVEMFHRAGFMVHIETNGTLPVPEVIDWITVSPKTSDTDYKGRIDELKVVYQGQDVEAIAAKFPSENRFLQPCSCYNTAEVVAYILDHPHWRLSLQTHKLIDIQ